MSYSDDLKRALGLDVTNTFATTFTSTLELGGVRVQVCLDSNPNSDLLNVAGTTPTRSTIAHCKASDMSKADFKIGDQATLDDDDGWQVDQINTSPDGNLISLTLIDAT